jgi:hypothetical protein
MNASKILIFLLNQVMVVQFCLAGSVSKYSKAITDGGKPIKALT